MLFLTVVEIGLLPQNLNKEGIFSSSWTIYCVVCMYIYLEEYQNKQIKLFAVSVKGFNTANLDSF